MRKLITLNKHSVFTGCPICGGKLVKIRGKYPHTNDREVCPTCLAEKVDHIKDILNPDYLKTFSSIPIKK